MDNSKAIAAPATADSLTRLGQQIRTQRKALRISATATAEAAGLSRVTLYRIEHGEPSVSIGAYLNVIAALGLDLRLADPATADDSRRTTADERAGWIPPRIRLADYPQLQQLAWQVRRTATLSPTEAASIYERNQRHLDRSAMTPHEQQLEDALRIAFGKDSGDV